MNVLSLFDGISCGQLALNRAGIHYDKYFASEINKYAIQVTQSHFPNTIQLGDIRYIDLNKLPKIDLILAGTPCQSFSFAGKQLNFDDPRGQLFFNFVEILNTIKPKYFLLENVLMQTVFKNKISEILGVKPTLINSNLFSAQDRKRLYWTNIHVEKNIVDKNIFIQDILKNIIDGSFNLDKKYIKKYNLEQFNHLKTKVLYIAYSDFNKTKIKVNNKLNCVTTKPRKSSIIIDSNSNIRYQTPLECERLQTLPDNYTNINNFSKSRRYELIGNCWTVDVISHILKGIVEN